MPVPSGYGESTLDYLCCAYGKFFAIETKTEGKKPTPRQEQTIIEMRSAGARVFVVSGQSDLDEVQSWLMGEQRKLK